MCHLYNCLLHLWAEFHLFILWLPWADSVYSGSNGKLVLEVEEVLNNFSVGSKHAGWV
jgi:hypothetical protein